MKRVALLMCATGALMNAQAIAGVKSEMLQVDAQVNQLVAEIDRAIAEADSFIAGLETDG